MKLTGHERCAQMLAEAYGILHRISFWYTEWNGETRLTEYNPNPILGRNEMKECCKKSKGSCLWGRGEITKVIYCPECGSYLKEEKPHVPSHLTEGPLISKEVEIKLNKVIDCVKYIMDKED